MRILVAAALVVAACNGRSGPAPTPGAGTMSIKPTVAAKVTAQKLGRPPLAYLTVEVALDNPTDAPRWFAIAKQIPPDDGAGGGVDRAEVRGAGAAVIGTFFGTGGFHAVRVGARSKLTITNLGVAWWRSAPDAAMPPLDVTIADELRLGGKPARDWFGVEPLVSGTATIEAGGEATHDHASDAEVAVEWIGGAHSTVDLAQ